MKFLSGRKREGKERGKEREIPELLELIKEPVTEWKKKSNKTEHIMKKKQG